MKNVQKDGLLTAFWALHPKLGLISTSGCDTDNFSDDYFKPNSEFLKDLEIPKKIT